MSSFRGRFLPYVKEKVVQLLNSEPRDKILDVHALAQETHTVDGKTNWQAVHRLTVAIHRTAVSCYSKCPILPVC